MEEDNSWDAGEFDDVNFSKNKVSYKDLIFMNIRKCIEAGCDEMREGYFNIKYDKFNNPIKTYISDTRKIFIECVETLKNILTPEIEEEDIIKIKEIFKNIEREYKKFCEQEKKDWNDAKNNLKSSWINKGISFREGYLNKELPYYEDYMEEKVKNYRKLFELLLIFIKDRSVLETQIYTE